LKNYFKNILKQIIAKLVSASIPELYILKDKRNDWSLLKSGELNVILNPNTKLYKPYRINDVEVGNYTYIARNAIITYAKIGKFCSIGPNLLCGWGIHPINGISTAPMFYSTMKQNGMTLSETDKIVERKYIVIGNDVFIGANVTILDGVTIGDGAVIGAGAIVSKNIPPYAVAVGSPIQIKKYRFKESQIKALLKIKWWDFKEEDLTNIEKLFFDIDEFIKKYDNP